MQKSIAVAALLGNIAAYKLKQRFIPGMDENDLDGLVMHLAESDNDPRAVFDNAFELPKLVEKPKSITKQIPRQMRQSNVQIQTSARSDPIFGSNGAPPAPTINTAEAILERDLASRKPFKWTLETDQAPETEKSMKWAEKLLKKKLEIPDMPDDEKDKNVAKYNMDDNQTLDEDITTTLGNSFYSEGIYGYRNRYNYHNNSGDAFVKSGQKAGVGGTSWEIGGNNGYNGYGYPQQHLDWWNHLIKD